MNRHLSAKARVWFWTVPLVCAIWSRNTICCCPGTRVLRRSRALCFRGCKKFPGSGTPAITGDGDSRCRKWTVTAFPGLRLKTCNRLQCRQGPESSNRGGNMVASRRLRCICSILGLTAVGAWTACGGSSSSGPPPSVRVIVHPHGASVVAGSQTQQFSATVNGDPKNLGVVWAVDGIAGGNSSAGSISLTGLYTPPALAGTHTVMATSVADSTKSASATIGVTDLTGITTYHHDLARDGVNSQEFALTTSNVKATTFGKLFSCAVDGAVYTETLWLPAVNVNGAVHNVIFLATQHDSLYAFDADANPCQQLWHVNLLDAAHGGTAGETPVLWSDVGSGYKDIYPEIGVTGTPVIDPATGTLYVISKSETSGPVLYQRLHAIDVTTGSEKFSAPKNISASVAGSGDGSSGGVLAFNLQSGG